MSRFREVFQRHEQEPPFRRIIYARTGNLSMTTQLNDKAESGFMRKAGLSSDVVITDSNKLPRNETRLASSDSLTESLRRLRKFTTKERSLYEIIYNSEQKRYEIQIHDKMIDDKVRDTNFSPSESYELRYLKELNMAVGLGLANCIIRDTLRLRIPPTRSVLGLVQFAIHKKDFIIHKEKDQ